MTAISRDFGDSGDKVRPLIPLTQSQALFSAGTFKARIFPRNPQFQLFEQSVCAHVRGRLVRVAIACAVLAFFGASALAVAEDGRGLASTAAVTSDSDSAPAVSKAKVSPNPLVAAALPEAPSISAEARTPEPLPITPVIAEPALTNTFTTNIGLEPIHALVSPPAALIKLKTQPQAHRFFDARNTFGLATLGVSLTADALSTQKGLAYPGFTEMNPVARPFVQSRMGAAAYNAGSFGLLAGLMYWAHKTEHHKLERILPFAVGSWEGLLSARNYRVVANRVR